MNNILTFEDYRKMNIRQVESVIYRQFVEEDIKKEDEVNEGIIRNFINKQSSKFIQAALGDEIEKGKELEKSIKEALDGLNKGFEEVGKNIDANAKIKPNMEAIEKVKEAIKAVQSQAFDTLTMIGSEGEIDFAGFMGSASVAAAANFGILFSPIRSVFMTRKAYKYFLGIIKQTIRRNLLIIQLNFDQFENLILQKSFETEDDSESLTMRDTLNDIIGTIQRDLVGKDSKLKFTGTKGKDMSTYLKNLKDTQTAIYKANKENTRNSPFRSLWEDQHNNTYTRTLEQIKQYINDDSQKELDALKNSITKMAGNDVELAQYGELLISAAEEYAIKTNHGINNNFIKMSSVFNLENQKKLIELIKNTQDENLKEIKKKQEEQDNKVSEEKIETGKNIYENELKGSTETYTLESFEKKFGDNIEYLKAYFYSEDGQDARKEFIERNPIYKYFIEDITSLNNLLNSIKDLTIVEVSKMKDFYRDIVNKEQTLYYMMAERSIKDAFKSAKPAKYFGFEGIKEDTNHTLTLSEDERNVILDRIIDSNSTTSKKGKKIVTPKTKYFLTFNGSGNGLFDILHNEFKTEIFKSDNEYVDNISTESKETIMKLIHKNLKIGNSIYSKFAEYLVRLEAHMLLESKKDPWFVVKDNTVLKDCFKPDSDKIMNKSAFVEISPSDYEDIKSFLTKYHILAEKDFDMETEETQKEEK